MSKLTSALLFMARSFWSNTRFNFGATGQSNPGRALIKQVMEQAKNNKENPIKKSIKPPIGNLSIIQQALSQDAQVIFNQFINKCSNEHPTDMNNIIKNFSDLYLLDAEDAFFLIQGICEIGLSAKANNKDWFLIMHEAFAILRLNRTDLRIKTLLKLMQSIVFNIKEYVPKSILLSELNTEYEKKLAEDRSSGKKNFLFQGLNNHVEKRKKLASRSWLKKFLDVF